MGQSGLNSMTLSVHCTPINNMEEIHFMGFIHCTITQTMQRGWCAKRAEEIIIPSLKYVRVANKTHSQNIKRFGRSRSRKQITLQGCSVSYVCNLPCLLDQQILSYILHIGFFFLLRAGSLNTIALPSNRSCTCQR